MCWLLSLRVLTIADGASRDIASNATLSAVLAVVVLLALGAAGAWWITRSRETGHGAVAWFAAFGSVAACISLTLLREGLRFGFQPARVVSWTTSGWDRLADGDLLGSSQFLLNVALFVPAGVAWTRVTGRPLRTLTGLVGLSMLIESVQGITGAGGADVTDVAANSLGAALGVGAAAIATTVTRRAGTATVAPTNPRRRAAVSAGLVVMVAVALAGLIAGAERRQARVRDELEAVFAATTYDQIAAVATATTDDPERFEDGATFTDILQIATAISVRADGFRYADNQIEIRWPALFFGFRRCVYVSWTPQRVDFRDESGSACTDFIG